MVAQSLHRSSFSLSQYRHAALREQVFTHILACHNHSGTHSKIFFKCLLTTLCISCYTHRGHFRQDFFFLDDFSSHAGTASHLPKEANHRLFPGTLISHPSVPPAPAMVSFTSLYKDRFNTFSQTLISQFLAVPRVFPLAKA